MKTKLMLIVMLLMLCITGCRKENDNDNNSSMSVTTEAPTVGPTDSAKVTVQPNVETTVPEETMSPNVETVAPGETVPPNMETVAPDESTAGPDGDGQGEDGNNYQEKEEKYEYIVEYSFGDGVEFGQKNRCVSQLNERIRYLSLLDVEAWSDNDKLYMGYNNKDYEEVIKLLAQKGEIVFMYGEDFLVFDNDEIKRIDIKQDYAENEILVFELGSSYIEEFYEFTSNHIGGNLVLSCDGTDIMQITIDMPVESGEFSVVKVPEQKVLDLFPVYIQSGTIIKLNPTTV